MIRSLTLFAVACAGTSGPTPTPTPADTDVPSDTDAPPDTDPPVDTDIGPAFDPTVHGPFAVITGTEQVAGSPAFSVQLFVPDGAPDRAVVLLGGFGLDPAEYEGTARHLASWGHLVAVPDLPGSVIAPRAHALLAEDLGRVLDGVESAQVGNPSLQVDAIAVVGHSLGGKIGLLRASTDPRIALVVGFDPVDAGPPFGGDPVDWPSVSPERMGDLTVPLVLLASDVPGDACAPDGEDAAAYFATAESPAIEVRFDGAGHMHWLDDPDCGLLCLACPTGTSDAGATLTLSRGIAVAAIEHVLRGTPGAREWLDLDGPVAAGQVSVQTANGF